MKATSLSAICQLPKLFHKDLLAATKNRVSEIHSTKVVLSYELTKKKAKKMRGKGKISYWMIVTA